jgi:phage tail tape-measure protein
MVDLSVDQINDVAGGMNFGEAVLAGAGAGGFAGAFFSPVGMAIGGIAGGIIGGALYLLP